MFSVTTSLLRLYEAVAMLIIGSIHDGAVQGKRVAYDVTSDKLPSHRSLGIQGKGWRYPEDSNTVFWWEVPTVEERAAVDAFLEKRGFTDLSHQSLHDKSVGSDGFAYSHGVSGGYTPERYRAKGKVRQPSFA